MDKKKALGWLTNVTSTIVLGELKEKIVTKDDLEEKLGPIKKSIGGLARTTQKLNLAVLEVQTVLETKYNLTFKEQVEPFIQQLSPIVLKDTFRHFITDVELDKQIEKQMPKLIAWLKKQKPETGIDAQNKIDHLVFSGEIKKFINLTDYKQNLYEKGKMGSAVVGILAVYLYEVLIPKIIKTKSKKKS